MNLANTIRLMAEKRDEPPFDVSKADYAGAAKELTQYAKTKGGMDKDDFLSFANRMAEIGKRKSPKVMAKFARDLGDLDTSPREKIVSVMRNNGIKVTMGNRGLVIEEHDVEEWEELDEAMVRGKEVFDKTFANRTQADNFAKKNGGRVKQVGRVFYVFKEAPEDEMPASPDEGSMAMQQLEFIAYAAEEIEDHIKKGGKFPEWMQNKLATVNDQMQSLHAQIDHDMIDDEEPEEMDEAVNMDRVRQTFNDIMKGGRQGPPDDDEVGDYIGKGFTKQDMAALIKMLARKGYDAKFLTKDLAPLAEAYKTPSEAKAYEDGKKAVAKKVSYDDNPNKKGTKEYTAWSKGHNDARAKMIGKRFSKEEDELDEATLTFDADPTTAKRVKSVGDNNNVSVTMKGKSVVLKGKDKDILRVMYKMKFPGNVYLGKIKEDVELTESPMVTFTVPNVTSDMASKLERLAKENDVEYSRKGRNVVLKGKRIDVTSIRTKMGIAQTNIPMIPVKEEVELNEARDPSKSGGTGYDLYHKDFSSAMKHAYDYAKKKYGIEIDPQEIDDKVASGPRKPSSGKTNTYRLKGKDGKKAVQIQVSNLDNKKYELNMYKESVEMDEKLDKDSFHTSVEKGKFMKSKYGRGEYQNAMFLHDLDSKGEPMLVTFAKQSDAEKTAKKYGGKIVKSGMGTFRIIKEEIELDEAMRVLATKGKTKVVTKGDGVARVMVGNKEVASGDLDDGAGGWFMSGKGEKGQKFFDSPKKIADYYAEEVEMNEEQANELFESAFEEEQVDRHGNTKSFLDAIMNVVSEKKELDPVDKKALKKDFDDREDQDLDNDGDVDDSDEYLHKRRKAVKKAISKQEDEPKEEVGKSGKQTKVDVNPSIEEEKGEEMTSAEMEKRDEIMKSLEKKKDEFVKKYGDRAKEVMARTAIKMAKKHA